MAEIRGLLYGIIILLILTFPISNMDNKLVIFDNTKEIDLIAMNLSHTPSDPILIHSDTDFDTQDWPGEGTEEFPYMIAGLIIDSNSTQWSGISISDTTVYFVLEDCILLWSGESCSTSGIFFGNVVNGIIRNCTIHSKLYGISFNNANYSSIDDCVIYDNRFDGIKFTNSNNCTVSNSKLFNNGNQAGIYVYNSEDCFLFDNTLYSNHDGICATGSNITISNCTTFQNEEDGFEIASDTSRVEDSQSFENGGYGISVSFGTNVEVVSNRLHSNYGLEIKLWLSSSKVNVYYNKIGPTIGRSLARDDGTDNLWDDGVSKGNYWSDKYYTDTYEISGNAESWDRYALNLTIAPLINQPADIEYHFGATGHNITWIPSGLCLDRYEVYRNDILLVSDDWDEFPIVVSVDGLEPSVYTYRIDVYDTSENKAVDKVIVSVTGDVITTSTQTTTTQGTLDSTLFILLSGATFSALVVIVLFLKIRKK